MILIHHDDLFTRIVCAEIAFWQSTKLPFKMSYVQFGNRKKYTEAEFSAELYNGWIKPEVYFGMMTVKLAALDIHVCIYIYILFMYVNIYMYIYALLNLAASIAMSSS